MRLFIIFTFFIGVTSAANGWERESDYAKLVVEEGRSFHLEKTDFRDGRLIISELILKRNARLILPTDFSKDEMVNILTLTVFNLTSLKGAKIIYNGQRQQVKKAKNGLAGTVFGQADYGEKGRSGEAGAPGPDGRSTPSFSFDFGIDKVEDLSLIIISEDGQDAGDGGDGGQGGGSKCNSIFAPGGEGGDGGDSGLRAGNGGDVGPVSIYSRNNPKGDKEIAGLKEGRNFHIVLVPGLGGKYGLGGKGVRGEPNRWCYRLQNGRRGARGKDGKQHRNGGEKGRILEYEIFQLPPDSSFGYGPF